jgi:uncharacterized protein YdaU (DUF1376 family)
MAELPILPLKTDALVSDTSHMTAEEFGAYTRILYAMWRHRGRLPYDLSELRRISGVAPRRWSRVWKAIQRPLTIADGEVSQKRLTATWLDVQETRRKRAAAAATRWKRTEPQKRTDHDVIYPDFKPLK